MVSGASGMLMDQQIFNLGLSVEVVSVYLLCVGVAETDAELTFDKLLSVWNGTEKDLRNGLIELKKRNILDTDSENNVTQIFSAEMWKLLG